MRQNLRDLFFILILGSVSILLLLWISAATSPRIRQYEETRLKAIILEAAGIDYPPDRLEEVFKDKIKIEKNYYISPDGFYIFEFSGQGMWDIVKGVVSLNPDLETIESVKIISQKETPGLGGRIVEEEFLKQFEKKKVSPRLYLALRKKAEAVNEVDAITGASLTSQSLVEMINESVFRFRELLAR